MKNKFYLPLLVIVLVSSLFVSLVYIKGYTGFAPGDPTNTKNIDIAPTVPEAKPCIDKAANVKCGGSCWLKQDGSDSGKFDDSKGQVGIVDWNGKCRDILTTMNDLCCGQCDCPLDYKCDRGICQPV